MIGEIYKNAKIVLSWLGTFNEDERPTESWMLKATRLVIDQNPVWN
jgi:hypothetical protein